MEDEGNFNKVVEVRIMNLIKKKTTQQMQKFREHLFDELVTFQEKKLMKIAERIRPNLTTDDLLQPNDYPELENHPEFRFEEGVLNGIHTARMAFLSANLS